MRHGIFTCALGTATVSWSEQGAVPWPNHMISNVTHGHSLGHTEVTFYHESAYNAWYL